MKEKTKSCDTCIHGYVCKYRYMLTSDYKAIIYCSCYVEGKADTSITFTTSEGE